MKKFLTLFALSVITLNAQQQGVFKSSAAATLDQITGNLTFGSGKTLTGATGSTFNLGNATVTLPATVSGGTSSFQPLDSDLTSWAAITRASGFDTFAATPSSANLAALVIGETGTGNLVFATSPTLTTPILGAATATSVTAPAATDLTLTAGSGNQGVSVAGTGSGATATAVNTGGLKSAGFGLSTSAGGPSYFGGDIYSTQSTAAQTGFVSQNSSTTGYAHINVNNTGTNGVSYSMGSGGSAVAVTELQRSWYLRDNSAGANRIVVTNAGVVNIPGTTAASSSTTGTLTIGNGTAATNVAIGGGNINAGGTLMVGASASNPFGGPIGIAFTANPIYAQKTTAIGVSESYAFGIGDSASSGRSTYFGHGRDGGGNYYGVIDTSSNSVPLVLQSALASGGNVLIGTKTNITGSGGLAIAGTSASTGIGTGALQVTGGIYAGAASVTNGIKDISPTAGIGYGTGAGGTVTQITSRSTGVTLNKVSGAITLFTAAGSATATSFTVTNSAVAATDTIVLSVKSATNKYLCFVTAVAAGSFEITFYTTGGTASDAPVINFAVLKAVSS
jgi:hypothetical protein